MGASEAGYPQALRAADINNFVPRIGLAVRSFERAVRPNGGPSYGYAETLQKTNRRQPQYNFPNPFGISEALGTITASVTPRRALQLHRSLSVRSERRTGSGGIPLRGRDWGIRCPAFMPAGRGTGVF